MKTKWNRILSISIVLSMLLGLVPSYAWEQLTDPLQQDLQDEEASADADADSSFFMSENVDVQFNDGSILVEGEMISEREAASKQFHLSSGLSLAVAYPYRVHYQKEDELIHSLRISRQHKAV